MSEPADRITRITLDAQGLRLTLLVDDEEYRVLRVPYRVRRFHEVLVTSQALRRGQPLVEVDRRRLEARAEQLQAEGVSSDWRAPRPERY